MPPKKKNKQPAVATQDLSKRGQADKLKELGNKSLQNENYPKAIELYTQAIEIDDSCFAYFHNRALALFLTEKYAASLEDAIKCEDLNSEYPLGYLRKAAAYLELDQLPEAQISATKGLALDPTNEALREILAKIADEVAKDSVLSETDPEILTHRRMINWLGEGGSEFSHLKMRWYGKNYRGVHASKKIHVILLRREKNTSIDNSIFFGKSFIVVFVIGLSLEDRNRETILFVPKSHLITLEMARETSVAKKIIAVKLNLLSPKHSFLSTFLLREKNDPLSPWRSYLDILPSDYNQFPVFFSEDDLAWLKGSPFQNQVREKRADIKRDYDEICGVAPEFLAHTFEDFCWARMTASSRVFGLTINEHKTDAFVPLADMLNHRRPKQTSWQYDDERGGFVIQALEDIPRGEQVYDSYGRKCNSRFFLNYGFINMDNDANEVAVRISFDADDPLLERKREMIGDIPEFKQFRILENITEQNVTEFMGYLRFILVRDPTKLLMISNMHESSAENSDNLAPYKPQKTPPLSIQNEIDLWTKFSLIVVTSLEQYPTTLQEDRTILADVNSLRWNQRNCLLLRIGEKEILEFYAEMSNKMLKLLKMNRKDILKVSLQAEYIKYNVYVNKVVIACLLQGQQI